MIIDAGLSIFEGMTSVSALIHAAEEHPDTARRVDKVYYDNSIAENKFRQLAFLKVKSQSLGFELKSCSTVEIDEVTTGKTHGGIIAICGERCIPELCADKLIPNGIYFLLEGIEDPYNFGYTLRALYAAGVDGVVLPPRNWMTAAGTVARSSAGCSELIDMFVASPDEAVRIFKSANYRILIANIRDSESLYEANLSAPALFVIGGEKRGVSRSILELSDCNIRIGYGREYSGSLPTAEAAAVIAFETARANGRIK